LIAVPESTRISPPDLTHINALPCRPDIVAKLAAALFPQRFLGLVFGASIPQSHLKNSG
jgi:hypothetical protein